jgi:hypothetical protein
MLVWPFVATAAGLPTVMRDAGTLVMFDGTPYAHLHICGDPWERNEYHPGDRGVWTMTYARPSPLRTASLVGRHESNRVQRPRCSTTRSAAGRRRLME